MEEVYKKCIEDYEISNFGNCKINDKIIKGSVNNRGYRYFQLTRNGKRLNYLFHHMVAYQFLGERPDDKVIDHIDRNKLNNNVSNLRYITQDENMRNTHNYRQDILETDDRLRTNILSKEAYRRRLAKQGKTATQSEFGCIRQRKDSGSWRCKVVINFNTYDKTFKTEAEAIAFLEQIKQTMT